MPLEKENFNGNLAELLICAILGVVTLSYENDLPKSSHYLKGLKMKML